MDQKPQIIIRDSLSELAGTGADIFASSAKETAINKGRFVTAISGGATPGPMHRLLSVGPYLSEIPWSKTHIFWVDDRCVPVSGTASNYGEARRHFLDMVPIPPDHIHNISVDVPPEEGALRYEGELIKFFGLKRGEFPVFDLIFTGIGTDGHTASLFPKSSALEENEKLVLSVKGGDPMVHRLTMTLPVLNNAKKIVFLVSGKNKSEILRDLLMQRQKGLPAGLIKPANGEIIWLVDREAASLLPEIIL
jgi:6-phosphogluconolactonase